MLAEIVIGPLWPGVNVAEFVEILLNVPAFVGETLHEVDPPHGMFATLREYCVPGHMVVAPVIESVGELKLTVEVFESICDPFLNTLTTTFDREGTHPLLVNVMELLVPVFMVEGAGDPR